MLVIIDINNNYKKKGGTHNIPNHEGVSVAKWNLTGGLYVALQLTLQKSKDGFLNSNWI